MVAKPIIGSTYVVITFDHKQFVGRFKGMNAKCLWVFESLDKVHTVKPESSRVEEVRERFKFTHKSNFTEYQWKLLFDIEATQVEKGAGRLTYPADEQLAHDLVQAGYVTHSYGVFMMTEMGWIISAQLRKHLSKNNGFAGFLCPTHVR